MLAPLLSRWLYPLLAFFFVKRVQVNGWSMHPTLAPGEYALFDGLAYRRGHPRYGDVVLALHPEQPGTYILKRVMGLPGDEVTSVDGARAWRLGPEEYFLLGDMLSHSSDSRHFGAVRRQAILARAWMVYWPPSRLRSLAGRRNVEDSLPESDGPAEDGR